VRIDPADERCVCAPWRELPEQFAPWQTAYERLTAFAAGRVADRIGRRPTILITDGEQRTADAVPVATASVDPRS
jgi:hypothetical protein